MPTPNGKVVYEIVQRTHFDTYTYHNAPIATTPQTWHQSNDQHAFFVPRQWQGSLVFCSLTHICNIIRTARDTPHPLHATGKKERAKKSSRYQLLGPKSILPNRTILAPAASAC